jgi:hypothetical protein
MTGMAAATVSLPMTMARPVSLMAVSIEEFRFSVGWVIFACILKIVMFTLAFLKARYLIEIELCSAPSVLTELPEMLH